MPRYEVRFNVNAPSRHFIEQALADASVLLDDNFGDINIRDITQIQELQEEGNETD